MTYAWPFFQPWYPNFNNFQLFLSRMWHTGKFLSHYMARAKRAIFSGFGPQFVHTGIWGGVCLGPSGRYLCQETKRPCNSGTRKIPPPSVLSLSMADLWLSYCISSRVSKIYYPTAASPYSPNSSGCFRIKSSLLSTWKTAVAPKPGLSSFLWFSPRKHLNLKELNPRLRKIVQSSDARSLLLYLEYTDFMSETLRKQPSTPLRANFHLLNPLPWILRDCSS